MLSYQKIKFSEQKRERKGAFITCLGCGKEFYAFPSRIKKGAVKYCSMKCYDKTGDKNPFWGSNPPLEVTMRFTHSPKKNKLKKGEDNLNHKRYTNNPDYWGTHKDWWRYNKHKKSSVCQRCGFDDLRILQIHHINRNRKDNSFDNIEIICPNCHSLEHYLAHDGAYRNLNPNAIQRHKGFAGKS